MRTRTTLGAILLLCLTMSPAKAADEESSSGDVSGELYGDGGTASGSAATSATGEGLNTDVVATTPGAPGEPGSEGTVGQAAGQIEPPPDGQWVTVSELDFDTDPPCVRTVGVFIEDVTYDQAREVERIWENLFVFEYEAHLSNGPPPPPCPTPDGQDIPGVDPTPAQQFADSAAERLPIATPTISGGKAITGLRSWLDLGRDSTFAVDKPLDLGPFSRTATMTATATATVDWGDGTVTTHTSRGGGYHDGEPGPDDIVHTYTDTADDNVLTVTDTWDVVVSVPGLEQITLTWQAPPVSITFDIDEVRSARDQ